MPSKDPQGRKWMLTINNPEEKGLNHQKNKRKNNTISIPDILLYGG